MLSEAERAEIESLQRKLRKAEKDVEEKSKHIGWLETDLSASKTNFEELRVDASQQIDRLKREKRELEAQLFEANNGHRDGDDTPQRLVRLLTDMLASQRALATSVQSLHDRFLATDDPPLYSILPAYIPETGTPLRDGATELRHIVVGLEEAVKDQGRQLRDDVDQDFRAMRHDLQTVLLKLHDALKETTTAMRHGSKERDRLEVMARSLKAALQHEVGNTQA